MVPSSAVILSIIAELEGVMARLSVLEGQSDKNGTCNKAEDDFDLFASENEDEDIDEIKQERLQRYAEKKSKSMVDFILLLDSYARCFLL